VSTFCSSAGADKLSVSPALSTVVFKSLCDLLCTFPFFILWKPASHKQMVPQKQGKSECAWLMWQLENLRLVERSHVLGGSQVALWEKWVQHAQHRADRPALRACAAQGWPLCTPSMRSTGLTAVHSEHAQHSVDGCAPWALWFAQPLSPWIHSPADTKGLLYCIWFFKPWIWAGATLSKEAFLAHPPGQGFTQSHSQCHIPHR
jgi:hypothetical protein